MNKRAALLALIIGLAAVVTYIIWRPTPTPQAPVAGGASAHQKVVINEAARTLLYLPLYHAIQKGYFKDAGLDVEVVTGGTATASFAAMVSGEADFSQADPMYVPIAREKGGKVKVVAQIVGRIAVWASTKNPEINDVGALALRGRKIVTHPKPMTASVYTERMVKAAGLDPEKDVTIIPAKPGTELAAFTSNNADLLVAAEPTTSIAVTQGARVIHSFPIELGDIVFSALMTREEVIEKERTKVAAIVAAYQRALDDLRADPAGVLVSARAYFTQVPEEVLATAVRRLVADEVFPKSTVITEASWSRASDVRVQAGDLTRQLPLLECQWRSE